MNKYGNKLILDCQQNLNFNHCKVLVFANNFLIVRSPVPTDSRWVEVSGCRAWAAAWESGFDFAVIPESPSPVCTELTCG
ncbi:hypothetical protein T06_13675 [Trichinella sp. T6]|nr:hypothetical protein T06_13675 [Trichinella sp. T6]